ncbi:hypothetical protein L1887_18437 [Cichorium endivia]|nr:hypothetical protein L1887_18437 [Cichorium endivia]
MSVNQSRGDKNEPQQYRRLGRSGNASSQRNYSGGSGKGGGGGGSTTAPPSSSSYFSQRSFKKTNNHAQGVQPGVNTPITNSNSDLSNSSTPGGATVTNGAHLQQPARGVSGTPKPTETPIQKNTPGLPRAPQGNAGVLSSDVTGPSTPTKGPADASKAFQLQFGSISPGLMNGMQIPARTSSAPPNLDEQKQAQARLESLKANKIPTQSISKQQIPRKDPVSIDQANTPEVHSTPKPKKDPQTTPAQSPAPQPQKLPGPGPPIPNVSMQMPFHHSPIHVPYGAPNPQIQSQGMPNMPLPIPLPMGNPPQQVFVTGIQHHPMQPQGIIHQGQGLNFSSQMGPPQMPPQLANMGIGYQPSPLAGKLGGHRKTVKITHPDTHEELRLDKRSDGYPDAGPKGPAPAPAPSKPHPHAGPIPSFPPGHPMNFYSNSYNPNPIFFQPPTNTQTQTQTQTTPNSQPPRFYNQVTVKPAGNVHEKASDSSLLGSGPGNDKNDLPKSLQKETEISKPSNAMFGSFQSENSTKSLSSSSTVEDSVSVSGTEVVKEVTVTKSGSFKDEQMKPVKKASEQTGSISSSSSETLKSTPSMEVNEEVSETIKKVVHENVTTNTPSGNEGGSDEENLKSNDTNLEIPLKNQDSKIESLESKEQEKDDITKEPEKVTDDKVSTADIEALNTETSSLNLGSSEGEDKTLPDTTKAKGNIGNASKSKKKRRDILKFADAQGTTSDLYMAYKNPEEKKEIPSLETLEVPQKKEKDVSLDEKRAHKFEPDDWEDAADISTPKLETNGKSIGNDGMAKKYSRDFLLKFSEQCTELPHGFELTPDIAEAVISNLVSRESYPSPGRSAARLDRRPSNVGHDDRWNKQQGQMGPGRDMRLDINVPGFRPVHGGVLRNPRAQPPVFSGGILSGPIQSPGHGVMQRNNSDSDRWQRVSGNQKGLIPSPNTPIPVMHKAERKYEVGKVTDEEQAKQRQLKGILNKLTPQNFEKLFEQVKQVNIDNGNTLSGVINQIFDKALMEPTFCEMYANFCSRLAVELPDFSEDNEKITFKRLLLNKCQEEFERGEREEQEANRTEEEGEVKQTEEEREEKRVKARRRMLGNIRLIGEIYKKKMLTERIMHECIKKLLGQYHNQNHNPDEENIESLCKLMSTIGVMIDHQRAKEHIDVYFDTMLRLSNNMKLSSRVRFMLKDVIDLRKNKWQQRRKVEGPKKIEEVHRDAAQERHAQTTRLARGPSFNSSRRVGPGPGPGPVQTHLPNSQFRGQQPGRGYNVNNQDARFDERQSFENRTLSIPLRPMGDNDGITLGPQGGLARGMSARGHANHHPIQSSIPVPEMPSPSPSGPNGYGNDPSRVWVPTPVQNVAGGDKVWPEERLRDMSMEAIKEFYSARDEKEVEMCIKDLNAPSFYPNMISIWVNDSFERKEVDRDLLAKLLVNLGKSQNAILNQDSFVRGLEMVLVTLEDAVNDAPKAAEYLGRIVGKMLLGNVIPYKEVWRLIYEGGEEQGRLVEVGLAAEVVGVILETIESEKGSQFLTAVRTESNLRVEEFRPPNSKKTLRLDKFV